MTVTWRRIGRLAFRRRIRLVAASVAPFSSLLFLASLQFTNALVPTAPLVVRLVIGLTFGAVCELLAVGVAALFYNGMLVSADGTTVRLGRSELTAEALDRFQLDATTARDLLTIRIGRNGGPMARLWLRGPSGPLLDHAELALLLTALERATIQAPRSIYDPDNRFTHYNFPGALTKEEAIDLVRHADDADYRLPLSS